MIRGFVFAIFLGVVLGTYSSLYVAKNIVLMLGWTAATSREGHGQGNEFANIDA